MIKTGKRLAESNLTEPVANAQQSDEETDLPPPALKIRSFHEALKSLEDVRNFWRESVVFLRSQQLTPSQTV